MRAERSGCRKQIETRAEKPRDGRVRTAIGDEERHYRRRFGNNLSRI
jgi:hypothetical protein